MYLDQLQDESSILDKKNVHVDVDNYLNEVTSKIANLEKKYAELCQSLQSGYLKTDENGLIIETNDLTGKLLGIDNKFLLKQNLIRYIAPDFQHVFIQSLKKSIKNPNRQHVVLKFLHRAKPLFYAQCTFIAITHPITEETNIVILIDKENYQKNESLSFSLTYGINTENLITIIAHELNQSLAIIFNYMNGCIRRLESGNFHNNEILEAMHIAAMQSKRSSEIILRMRDFSYKGVLKFESVDINALILETISLIYIEFPNTTINITYNPIKNIPLFTFDKIHIQQVLINIARNAIESMRDADTSDPKITIEINLLKKDKIAIHILDNGPGISPKIMDKIFNPYFTTKPYGIGLGLAICLSILEAHNGNLIVEKSILGGACFKIILSSQNAKVNE